MADETAAAVRFRRQHMAGYLSGGHEHGVEITSGADGKPVTRAMCLNLEHYYARGQAGRFVPRYGAQVRSEVTADGRLRCVIEPSEEWRVRTTLSYALLPDGVVQATYQFEFGRDYAAFEGLVSNYFHEPGEPYLHIGGDWVRPQLGEREHRTWARDGDVAALHGDGRHDSFHEEIPDFVLPLDGQRYDLPIMVSPIRDTGWSVVHVVEPEQCASLSVNRRWHAHDFSLVGRDVAAGDTVTCRAWMAYVEIASPGDSLVLMSRLVGEGARGRP